MRMRREMKYIQGLLCLVLFAGGCATIRSLEAPSQEYYIQLEPILSEAETYYVDSIDSSVVWSEEGQDQVLRR